MRFEAAFAETSQAVLTLARELADAEEQSPWTPHTAFGAITVRHAAALRSVVTASTCTPAYRELLLQLAATTLVACASATAKPGFPFNRQPGTGSAVRGMAGEAPPEQDFDTAFAAAADGLVTHVAESMATKGEPNWSAYTALGIITEEYHEVWQALHARDPGGYRKELFDLANAALLSATAATASASAHGG